MSFEREYRILEHVPRWPIVYTILKQNVASHSFYVALYAGQVADLIEYKGDRAMLLDMALRHDLEECFTSDLPGPSKRAIVDDEKANRFIINELNNRFDQRPAFREIPLNEELSIKLILKVAGLLDEVFFLANDQQRGNKSVSKVLEHSYNRLRMAWHNLCDVMKIDGRTRDRGVQLFAFALDAHMSEQSKMVEG